MLSSFPSNSLSPLCPATMLWSLSPLPRNHRIPIWHMWATPSFKKKKNPYFIAQYSKYNHVFLGLFAGFILPARPWASPSNRECGLKLLRHINTTTSFQSSFHVRLLIYFPLLIWSLSVLVGDLFSLVQDFGVLVKQKLFSYLFSKHKLYIEDGRSFWVWKASS